MNDNKTEQLSLRMSPRAKKLLRVAAVKEHRSASNMVEHLVLEYCEQHSISLDDGLPNKKQQTASKDEDQ